MEVQGASELERESVDFTGSSALRMTEIPSEAPKRTVDNTQTPPTLSSQSISLRHRPSRLSKYGVAFQPPEDDAIHYHDDAKEMPFFAKGRDFESTFTNHKYTSEEKETLRTYESQDYLPSHSEVYKNWIKRQPSRLDWDLWVMMGLIGFVVGFIGFLLHQTIEWLTDIRINKASEYLAVDNLLLAWGWCVGFSTLFLLFGTVFVVYLRPSAAGSGIPELICFLNGTQVRHIFNVKTLVIKFISCCLSVGSGLPVGPEGPMIHLGSLVGAGISQFKSDTLKVQLPFFERFRNSEDRRNFVSAGAAAGVSAAFGAPVGGLLFSMEEVSSFWNDKLSWQIFFCCMISVFTSSLFNSAFKGFDFTGSFGLFKSTQFILFKVYQGFDFHIAVFVPTILIGVLGGALGGVFTIINLKIARARKRILSSIASSQLQRLCRVLEPLIILILYISISVFLPAAFPCTPFQCMVKSNQTTGEQLWCEKQSAGRSLSWLANISDTQFYNCPPGVVLNSTDQTAVFTNKTYNQVSTLLMTNGERAIKRLFSRETHAEFEFFPLLAVFLVYFLCACWSAGTAISSGLVVPMLLIGAIYGRMIGIAMVKMFGVFIGNTLWAWIDPGAMALIGAASFFGGVTRLTMSLTVIMMELTNDIQFLLPIMVAIMVAKWVGDFFTHPMYHALLELKCIPFLASEPIVYNSRKRRLNLELYTAGNVMSSNVVTFDDRENVKNIAEVLLNTTHSGFPVLGKSNKGHQVFVGTITRLELTVLLRHQASFIQPNKPVTCDVTAVEYEQLTIDKLDDPAATEQSLLDYANLPQYTFTKIYLRPYINQSAMTVRSNFSLHRTYIIFRTLGLRHLTVLNPGGEVVGMITRRDLMGFNLEERLDKVQQNIGKFTAVARTFGRLAKRRAGGTSPATSPQGSPLAARSSPAACSYQDGITSDAVVIETPESD